MLMGVIASNQLKKVRAKFVKAVRRQSKALD